MTADFLIVLALAGLLSVGAGLLAQRLTGTYARAAVYLASGVLIGLFVRFFL